MKLNYAVQYNNGRYSCGPVALLNALRFQGHRVFRRHLPWLARELKSNGHGVHYLQLERVGRAMGALKRIRSPSWDKILEHLKRGNGVILMWIMLDHNNRYLSHVMFISSVMIHGHEVLLYVANLDGTSRWISIEGLDDFFGKFGKDAWPEVAWYVPKEGKELAIPK